MTRRSSHAPSVAPLVKNKKRGAGIEFADIDTSVRERAGTNVTSPTIWILLSRQSR